MNTPEAARLTDEIRYRLLTYLSEHPQASQRDVAEHLNVSVGKVNYCLRALAKTGLLKMRNLRRAKKKVAYAYVLTPRGIEEKVNVTLRFLKSRIAEYEAITAEIARLTQELAISDAKTPKGLPSLPEADLEVRALWRRQ